jgi:hypothetical protein
MDGRADDSAGATKRRTLAAFYAERFPNPTRASSPRQLPTDHDHAVPTREYQSDQSSRQLLRCHRLCRPNQKSPRLTSRNVFPLRRPSKYTWMPERCSRARVRFAASRPCSLRAVPARQSCDGRLRREHFTACGGTMKRKRPAGLLAEASRPELKPAKPGGA